MLGCAGSAVCAGQREQFVDQARYVDLLVQLRVNHRRHDLGCEPERRRRRGQGRAGHRRRDDGIQIFPRATPARICAPSAAYDLGGTQVYFNGIRSPLFRVSPTQITAAGAVGSRQILRVSTPMYGR